MRRGMHCSVRALQDLGVTHSAASSNMNKLVELDTLGETRHDQRPRLFITPDVMTAVESDSADGEHELHP